MRCKEIQQRLAEYSADALPPPDEAVFAAHLEACPDCRLELEVFDGVLRRLEAAAPAAAPDLWNSFQAALARDTGECDAVVELLPAWAADELSAEEGARTHAHLDVCGACAKEARSFRRSLEALREGAEPGPDLWPVFARRLASQVTCAEASDLLPAYLGGDLLETWNWPLEYHLETCAVCAAERLAYEKAERALARVAASPVEVDLWPAFERRLQAERARRGAWTGWLAPAAAAWRSLWEQPLARPVFAAGLAALAIALVAPRLQSPPSAETPERLARVPVTGVSPLPSEVEPEATAPAVRTAPEAVRESRNTASRPATRRTPRRYRVAPKRVSPRRAPRGPELAPDAVKRAPAVVLARAPRDASEAPVAAVARESRWRGMTVAFNPDLAGSVQPVAYPQPAVTMSGEMQQAVKQDFVEFTLVIEEIRDVAAAPLEAGSDAE